MTPSFPRDGVSGKPGVIQGVAEVVGEVRGEEAEEHVGFDAVFQVVVHGS